MIRPHLKYLRYLLKHKYGVFVTGLQLGVPVSRLLWHDMDKFLPSMWFPFVDRFYRDDEPKPRKYIPEGWDDFREAWGRHVTNHDHHLEYWIPVDTPMSTVAILEMVADWSGAGYAQAGEQDPREWYREFGRELHMSDWTRTCVENVIEEKWGKI